MTPGSAAAPAVTGWRTSLDPDEAAEIRVLADGVEAADGVAALSETVMLDLAGARPEGSTRHLLARDADGVLVGYAHVDGTDPTDVVVEMAVRPDRRRGGVGGVLVRALGAELAGPRAWAHGDHPAAARLAARVGMAPERELWMMRREADAGELPRRPAPPGVTLRPLRVGTDEEALVAVNNRAFAWHPEQGGWDVAEVRLREDESWFDPEGVILAWDDASGELLGFHWTKVHAATASAPEAVGEVYVLGVDPAAQGRGLGGVLTLAGLHHLAARGLGTVILYVEGDNAPAIATYRKLGFERAATDVSYAVRTPSPR